VIPPRFKSNPCARHARVSGAKYVELAGDDHVIQEGDADAILDEIEIFLTGVRRGPEPDRVLATISHFRQLLTQFSGVAIPVERVNELVSDCRGQGGGRTAN